MLKGIESRKKLGPFILTKEARDSFDNLRRAFIEAPMLRHFDPDLNILVETDASAFAIGAVLSQLFGTDSGAK